MVRIVPTLLCQTIEELAAGLQRWQKVADRVQIDFADGQFVANNLPAPGDVNSLPTTLNLECHLMVKQPENWIAELLPNPQVETIIAHLESELTVASMSQEVRRAGRKFGLALRPETPVSALQPYYADMDMAMLLGVNPGFNGSPFLPSVVDKVHSLRALWPDGYIAVDGGITPSTIGPVVAAGADQVAVGSFVSVGDPRLKLAEMEMAAMASTK